MQEDREYQRSSQHRLVEPFIARASSYDPSVDGDLPTFMMRQITGAIHMRSEHEEIPGYIRQVESYIHGSELCIVLEILNIVHSFISHEYFEPSDVSLLIKGIEEFAFDRGWPMGYFHQKIFMEIGIGLMGIDRDPGSIGMSSGSDYN